MKNAFNSKIAQGVANYTVEKSRKSSVSPSQESPSLESVIEADAPSVSDADIAADDNMDKKAESTEKAVINDRKDQVKPDGSYIVPESSVKYRNEHLLDLLDKPMSSLIQQSIFLSPREIAALDILSEKYVQCNRKRYALVRLLLDYALDNLYPGFMEIDEVKEREEEIKQEFMKRQKKKYTNI